MARSLTALALPPRVQTTRSPCFALLSCRQTRQYRPTLRVEIHRRQFKWRPNHVCISGTYQSYRCLRNTALTECFARRSARYTIWAGYRACHAPPWT